MFPELVDIEKISKEWIQFTLHKNFIIKKLCSLKVACFLTEKSVTNDWNYMSGYWLTFILFVRLATIDYRLFVNLQIYSPVKNIVRMKRRICSESSKNIWIPSSNNMVQEKNKNWGLIQNIQGGYKTDHDIPKPPKQGQKQRRSNV